MATIAELNVRIGAKLEGLMKGLDQAQTRMKKFGDQMGRVGRDLSTKVTAPIVGIGAAIAKTGSDFEQSFGKIQNLVGVSADEIEMLKKGVLGLAGDVGRSPQELSEALFVVTSAGAEAGEAMEIVAAAARSSAIGMGETQTVARAVTAAMAAYQKQGLTAAQATDTLAAAVRAGNLEADSLAPVLGRVIGIAADMGVTFEEVTANIATYTRLGISAEEATTALRTTLASIKKPGQDAEKAANELGISFDQIRRTIREDGLQAALAELITATDGNEEALGRIIPSVEALSGVLGTAGSQGEDYKEILDSINDSTGLVDDAFKNLADETAFKLQQAFAKLKSAAIAFFEPIKPFVNDLIDRAKDLFDRFQNLDERTKKLVITAAALAAALGPIALAVSGIIAVMNPWVVAIGLAITAATLLIQNWDDVKAWFDDNLPGVTDAISEAFERISFSVASEMSDVIESVKTTFNDLRELANEQLSEDGLKIGELIGFAVKQAARLIGNAVELISAFIDQAMILFRTGLKVIKAIYDQFAGIFTGDWERFWGGVKDFFGAIWEGIVDTFKNVIDAIFDLIPGGDALRRKLGFDVWEKATEDVETATWNFKSAVEETTEAQDDNTKSKKENSEATDDSAESHDRASESTKKYTASLESLRKKIDGAMIPAWRHYNGLVIEGVEANSQLDSSALRTSTSVEDLGDAVGDTSLGFEGWASVLTSDGGLGRGIDQLMGKLGSDGLLGHIKGLFNSIGGGEGLVSTLTGEGGLTGSLSKVAAALGPGAPIAAAFIAATQIVKKYADEINGAIGALSDFFGFSGGGASEMRDEIITDELKKQFRQSFEASGMTATAFVDLAMKDEDKAAFINDLFGSPEDAATFLAGGVIGGTGLSSTDAAAARNADAWANNPNNPNNPANQGSGPVSRPEGDGPIPDFTGGAPDLPDSKTGPEGSGRDRPPVGSGRGFGHFQEMGREFGDLADVMHEEFGSGRFCRRLEHFGENVAGMVPNARDIGESVANSMYHGARDARAGVNRSNVPSRDIIVKLNDREVGRAMMDGTFPRRFVDEIIARGG